MNDRNGTTHPQVDPREVIAQQQARIMGLEQRLAVKDQHAAMITQMLCGMMHRQGWDTYKLPGETMEACFDHNGFRVRVEWEDATDGEHRNAVLTLAEWTPEEREALEAKRAEQQAKADAENAANAERQAEIAQLAISLGVDVARVSAWTPMQQAVARKWCNDGKDEATTPPHVREAHEQQDV